MSNQNNGGPAFPVTPNKHDQAWAAARDGGMTLRDYFAAKAMQAIQTTPGHVNEVDGSDGPDPLLDADIARLAYHMADAMLKERDK